MEKFLGSGLSLCWIFLLCVIFQFSFILHLFLKKYLLTHLSVYYGFDLIKTNVFLMLKVDRGRRSISPTALPGVTNDGLLAAIFYLAADFALGSLSFPPPLLLVSPSTFSPRHTPGAIER